jgi:hypothetical protein
VAHNKYRALGPRTPEDLLLWTGSERRSGRPGNRGLGVPGGCGGVGGVGVVMRADSLVFTEPFRDEDDGGGSA